MAKIPAKQSSKAESKSSSLESKTTTITPTRFTSSNIISSLLLLSFFGGFLYYSFSYLPYLLDQTIDAKERRIAKDIENRRVNEQNRKKERAEKLLKEDPADLKITDRTVVMATNFGELSIKVQDKAAPKTAESFVRNVNRKYYDKTEFHRIVKNDSFTVIQGGDPEGNGTGGESAFGTPLEDEIFTVKPELAQDGSGTFLNDPKFVDDSLYTNLNKTQGTVEYRKGLIIMANSGPNTGGSQFFITLDKTVLPAAYTIFGVIEESSFGVLDKINKEVGVIARSQNSQTGAPANTKDGTPDKELFVEKAYLK
jgi:cyclophilin family peptidyl-prolyl cis-trans isomerase